MKKMRGAAMAGFVRRSERASMMEEGWLYSMARERESV